MCMQGLQYGGLCNYRKGKHQRAMWAEACSRIVVASNYAKESSRR